MHVTDERLRVCVIAYRDFLLRDDHDTVGSPHPHGRQPALRDGFEGILCKKVDGRRIQSKQHGRCTAEVPLSKSP